LYLSSSACRTQAIGQPDIGLAVVIDEFDSLDRVAHRADVAGQAHTLGHIPAGAEEIHHVAFGAQGRVALDHVRLPAVPAQEHGEG
jgi:hypothetical protein